MKKILPLVIGLIGLLLLTGCSKSMEDTLTADDGIWKIEGFNTPSTFTFYEGGQINVKESGYSVDGIYDYNKEDKKLTVSIEGIEPTVFTSMKEKNGEITAIFNDNKITLKKWNNKTE